MGIYVCFSADVSVELSDSEYEVEEQRRSVSIGVQLLGSTNISVEVQISTTDGTADGESFIRASLLYFWCSIIISIE